MSYSMRTLMEVFDSSAENFEGEVYIGGWEGYLLFSSDGHQWTVIVTGDPMNDMDENDINTVSAEFAGFAADAALAPEEVLNTFEQWFNSNVAGYNNDSAFHDEIGEIGFKGTTNL